MEMNPQAEKQLIQPVRDSSHIGEARRSATRLAESTTLNEADRGKVAIVATELATNLIRHGGGGELILRQCRTASNDGVELLALDNGPGMADVGKCLADGFSTAGTPGTGLGAARRLSTAFDIYSRPSAGTAVFSRICTERGDRGILWGVVRACAPGELACGDSWSLHVQDDQFSILVADGLGHGPLAAQAADEAVGLFDKNPFAKPATLLENIHSALHTTRGAAAAIAQCSASQRVLHYVGVGNIAGSLIDQGKSRGLFSHNGTVGHQIRRIQEFEYAWSASALLVIHSDGLQSRWNLENYPGLSQRHPALVAGVLYRDFKRGRDDVTVLAVR